MNTDVMLIYPYFRTFAPTELLFQPLGIAYLASQIKSLRQTVSICDCTFITFEKAIADIIAKEPDIIGISVMITLSANALRMVRVLRESLPKTLFACGGPLPTLYPERFTGDFDVVFRGESDLMFAAFCRDYLALDKKEDFNHILNISQYSGIMLSRRWGSLVSPSMHHNRSTLDSLPLPDRSYSDHKSYQKFWLDKTGFKPASIIMTRGCPFNCDFCSKPVFGNHFRTASVAKIMQEIIDIKNYGYDQLWIADDCLTLDLGFLKEFCLSMLQSKINMSWTCLARADSLTEDNINLMRNAGCRKIYMGLESGDNETLRLMNKKTTVESGIEAVYKLQNSGIGVGGFFIVGYPGETITSIEKTFSLALSLPLDEISFNVPFPLPGSPLYTRVRGLDRDADWDIENETKFVFHSEFDPACLKERINETMQAFNIAKQTGRQASSLKNKIN